MGCKYYCFSNVILKGLYLIKDFRGAADKGYNKIVFLEFQMAIDGISRRTHAPLTGGSTQKADVDSANKTSVKQADKADSVVITAAAKEIKKALESSSSGSVIDFERVAAVKKALADGSYQINAEKIAEKMIQHEKSMSGHDKSKQ
jgi:negative regulator of flagellin synthesis FlgM